MEGYTIFWHPRKGRFHKSALLDGRRPIEQENRLKDREDFIRRDLAGGMNIDDPFDPGIDDVTQLHDLSHDPDHFVEIGIVKIKDES